MWKTFPSDNDKFAGWAKRICELQSSAYEIQYKWRGVSIVRPQMYMVHMIILILEMQWLYLH